MWWSDCHSVLHNKLRHPKTVVWRLRNTFSWRLFPSTLCVTDARLLSIKHCFGILKYSWDVTRYSSQACCFQIIKIMQKVKNIREWIYFRIVGSRLETLKLVRSGNPENFSWWVGLQKVFNVIMLSIKFQLHLRNVNFRGEPKHFVKRNFQLVEQEWMLESLFFKLFGALNEKKKLKSLKVNLHFSLKRFEGPCWSPRPLDSFT